MRTLSILLFDGVNALDVTGPAEAFAAMRDDSHAPSYRLTTLALERLSVVSESGLCLRADRHLEGAPSADLLIIPGGAGLREPKRLARAAQWLRKNHRRFARVAAVCTGAYALAEASLLDGRRSTTHWRFVSPFARAYPKTRVEMDALFVRDGKFYTSGGIAAGIDLGLSIIEEDHGARAAAMVARELVVFLRRTGGQAQFSEPLKMQVSASDKLSSVCVWAAANLGSNLRVPELAQRAGLSTRQFTRLFTHAYGVSPAHYIQRLRLDSARAALSSQRASIERIAHGNGFSSADAFRRAFERAFGINPSEYQRRFALRKVRQ
jgi:transcriptional regulator GlxA family with amidase domain